MAREGWQREIDRLREDYRRRLPQKLADLEARLRAALRSGGRAGLEAALLEAHSLKGSSGSYGFAATSRELQGIEDAIRSLLERGPQERGDPWPELEARLARARSRFAAA